MKKNLFYILLFPILLSGCYAGGMRGNPAAVQAGASIGGIVGSVIGDRTGGYGGSQFGAILGTVAGAAIGNAVTTPQNQRPERNRYRDNYNQNDRVSEDNSNTTIDISNIRFIDSNRNRVISRNEDCKLIFNISNEGNLAAYNVTPIIKEVSENGNIYISEPAEISYLGPGDKVKYTAVIRGGKRLRDGHANFQIYTVDSNGSRSDVETFSIDTSRD